MIIGRSQHFRAGVWLGTVLLLMLTLFLPHDATPVALVVTMTPSAIPTATDIPIIEPTAIRMPTATAPAMLSASPYPTAINGFLIDQIFIMPEAVKRHIHIIYTSGQMLGRNPRAFSKVGDSTIENPHFLARFDGGEYNLGEYDYLQPVISYYAGSFGRQSVSVRRGLHSWSLDDPFWADKSVCLPNEAVLNCEFRIQNPSIVFIRLGSNDVGVPDSFDKNIRKTVEFALANGIIPILGTKADRHEGGDNVNNNILRQIADDFAVPLWDFDLLAATLPARGLDLDGIHMTTFYAHDYTSPIAFERGHGMHNLTALMALDKVWREISAENQ